MDLLHFQEYGQEILALTLSTNCFLSFKCVVVFVFVVVVDVVVVSKLDLKLKL